jgi:RNA polymerase sigma factor (sigma-70 family)
VILRGVNESFEVTALVAAAADGDEVAWQRLVDRYTPLVASVAHGFRLHGTDVDDVAQTVWLRLVENLRQLREPRALPMWIITTTRNECLRQVRASLRTRPFDPLTEGAVAGTTVDEPDEHLIGAARHQALLAGLAELPEHQRALLLLLIEDPPVPYAEICRRLHIKIGSIGPTRARALERLRACPQISGLSGTGSRSQREGSSGS